MTPTPDPTIPDRGDPITMLGGQFSGQHGTMLQPPVVPFSVTPENWQRLSDEQEKRRRARGYFTVEEAAQALGEQEGMHRGARQTLLARMMEAARDGHLTVRDPRTDLPFRPAVVHEYYELVTPADVNAWLERGGVEYRWSVPAVELPAADHAGSAEAGVCGEAGVSECRHDHGADITGDMPAGLARCRICGEMLPMYVPITALMDRVTRLADRLEQQTEKDDWR